MTSVGPGPLVGLVVEGETEYQALPEMLARLGVRCARPSCFHGQSVEAPVEQLVKHVLSRHVRVQLTKGVDKVVVLLDFEGRQVPPTSFRNQVKRELTRQVCLTEGEGHRSRIEVVLCNPKFENWLLSDPKGIMKSKLVARDLSRKVTCHADGKDAISLLKLGLRKGVSYRKAVHGPELAKRVRVEDTSVRQCS